MKFELLFTTSICLTRLKHKSDKGKPLIPCVDVRACLENRAWNVVLAMSDVADVASATTSSVKSFSVSVLLQMGHCDDCSKCANVQSILNWLWDIQCEKHVNSYIDGYGKNDTKKRFIHVHPSRYQSTKGKDVESVFDYSPSQKIQSHAQRKQVVANGF